jgi:hypothetical protein
MSIIRKSNKYFVLVFLVLAWATGYCQKLKAIDRKLAQKYLKVLDWGIEGDMSSTHAIMPKKHRTTLVKTPKVYC